MATITSCDHPPLHDNIIFKCRNREAFQKEVVYNKNILFVLIEQTLLIVDSTDYIAQCRHCEEQREIYIYGEWPNVRASFDGATDLPICAMVNDIAEFPYIKICNEPRFGNNFIYGCNLQYQVAAYFVMYGIEVTVKGCSTSVHKRIFIYNEPAICCYTVNGKFMLIKFDGSIINAKVAYSETCKLFKIGDGYLTSEFDDNRRMVWTYTSLQALNTKPAARE
jgi:hypothetical protein